LREELRPAGSLLPSAPTNTVACIVEKGRQPDAKCTVMHFRKPESSWVYRGLLDIRAVPDICVAL
jgi:hypothetical protein